MAFHAYVFFSGNCAEAFNFYHRVFGGKLDLMRHGDTPPDARMPGVDDSAIMHAALRVGDGLLMGSDDPTGDDGPKQGFAVSYTAPDVACAEKIFAALSDGGEVTMPMAPTFWATAFGMCTDRFGVAWMVDTEVEPDA